MAADDHQQIIEVMRDAACQLTESVHFLRLGELLLCPFERDPGLAPFGDIMRDVDKADERARLVPNCLDHNTRPKLALITSHAPAFKAVLALVSGHLNGASRLA